MSRRLEYPPWRSSCSAHGNRGGGLEPRPHPLEEFPGAHRPRLAQQMEETPALPVPVAHEGPPRPGGDAAEPKPSVSRPGSWRDLAPYPEIWHLILRLRAPGRRAEHRAHKA